MKKKQTQESIIIHDESPIVTESPQIRLSALQSRENAIPGPSVLKSLDDSVSKLAGTDSEVKRKPEPNSKRKRRTIKRPRLGFD